MTYIFEHTDEDGDRFAIETETDASDGVVLYAETVSADGNDGAFLTREAVDRLRAALAPYGTKPEAADIAVGGEYRLLPGATFRGDRGVHPAGVVSTGATRVRVDYGPDSYGDVSVTALDGTDAGNPGWFVDPAFLAPLGTVATPEAVAVLAAKLAEPDPAALIDPLRLAAWEKASEMLRGYHAADARDVLSLSAYLLGESA